MFWLYWILAIVVSGFIIGSLRGIMDIKSPSIFSKENSISILETALDMIITYFLFSAVKGEWIF